MIGVEMIRKLITVILSNFNFPTYFVSFHSDTSQIDADHSVPSPIRRQIPPPTSFCSPSSLQRIHHHHLEERSESSRPHHPEVSKASSLHMLRPSGFQHEILTGFEEPSESLQKKFAILKGHPAVESGKSEDNGLRDNGGEENRQKVIWSEGNPREISIHSSRPHVMDLTGQGTGSSLCEGFVDSRPSFSVRQAPSASDLSLMNLPPTVQKAYEEDRRIFHISSSSIGGGSRFASNQDNCSYR